MGWAVSAALLALGVCEEMGLSGCGWVHTWVVSAR